MKTIKIRPQEKRVAISSITVEAEVDKKLTAIAEKFKISKAQICRHLIESYIDDIKFTN